MHPVIPPYQATRDSPMASGLALVVGNGNSMLGFDQGRLRGFEGNIHVANSGYLHTRSANILMCSDRHWLAAHPDLSEFYGSLVVVTQPQAVARVDPRMRTMRRAFIEDVKGDPFGDPGLLVEGHNSTSTNISLAVLHGARRIILLGVDLAPGPGLRRSTYNTDRDEPARAAVRYARQVVHLTRQATWVKARGVEVINASPRSALACYPYATLEEAIKC